MRDSYLPLAGVESGDVNITHAIRCRYRKKKGNGQWYSMVFDKMFQTREVRAAMHHCKVHDKDIKGEKLIVAMGELGHLKYGGPAANDSQQIWRGHLAPEV